MGFLREWRRRRVLRKTPVAQAVWTAVLDAHPVLRDLDAAERGRLRELATVFLDEKDFVAVQGLELDADLRVAIAALACLPILGLGLDWYRGWYTLIVYPAEFVSPRRVHDEYGLVHEWEDVLGGEASSWGPVVLSAADVRASGQGQAYNVVVHEMAHKLDMLNGEANGCPPLQRGMSIRDWSAAWSRAYEDFSRRLERGEEPGIDPYAGEDPAEFFAVLSEYFFEQPREVRDAYPAVYGQLTAFYRRDPLLRRAGGAA